MAVRKKNPNVRDFIKKVRAGLGMSQAAFAKYIGTNLATLQRWESATAAPGGLMVIRLFEAGVDITELGKAFEADAALPAAA